MPQVGSGGSLITGANVVDESLGTIDLSAAAKAELEPTVTSVIPLPDFRATNIDTSTAFNGNTTAFVGRIVIPFKITANKVTIDIGIFSVSGTLKIALFAENGQSQIFSFTTASITATGLVITTLGAATVIPAGIYYIVVVPVSTVNIRPATWKSVHTFNVLSSLFNGVTGSPDRSGILTVTADTMPATIDPTSLTTGDDYALVFRLDN